MRRVLSLLVLSLLVLSFVLSFVLTVVVRAQVPAQLSYQGLLTTPQGTPISDGAYTVTFRLYADADDGQPTEALFEETQSVAVASGLFSTLIGKEALLDLPFDEPYFLTVEVEGQAESAKMPLSTAPYALNVADGAVVRSLSGLRDEVEIVAGDGIAIEQRDNQLVISALSAPVGLRGAAVEIEPSGEAARKGPGGSNTGLDAAYDAGRVITADAGGVEIQGTSGSTPLRIFNGNLLFEDNTGGKPNLRFKTSGGTIGTQEWRFNLNAIGYLTLRDATGGANVFVLVPGAQENLLRLTGGAVELNGVLSRPDGQPLEVKVGGARVMRYEPETATDGPNVLGGWSGNVIGANVEGATIAGGGDPDLSGTPRPNEVTGDYGTVGGGRGNEAGSSEATVGGGSRNTASGQRATVAGGAFNTASAFSATVGGGGSNTASGDGGTVGGGDSNEASGQGATVGGGFGNTASAFSATVGGGRDNTASGTSATVPGGRMNQAGGEYSFAAGYRAKVRDAAASGDSNGDEGTFVWADSTDADFTSTGPDQFLIRAAGGLGIGTNAPVTRAHLRQSNLGILPALDEIFHNDVLLVEGGDAIVGLYGDEEGTWGAGLVLGEVTPDLAGLGVLVDKWAVARQTTDGMGDSSLRFTFGTNDNYGSNDTQMRIEAGGDVRADGAFIGGGADLAEAFAVEGALPEYTPGEVLVISTRTDRTVEKSTEAYSALVAGVYATKPGVLLHEGGMEADLGARVPMGVVGVIPTKVTLEGGPIRRGDLLVTSSTPGHAMKADGSRLGFGMVLGKALAAFEGPGSGLIEVLVNVK